MTKRFEITEEEFEAIKEAIRSFLQLWQYDSLEVSNGITSMSMSVKTFFEGLKREFVIE